MGLFHFSRQPTLVESYLYPFAALLLIIVADQLIDSVLLTPMLSICALALMTFRLETKVLAFWLVVFACNVIFSLLVNPGNAPELNMGTVIVRFISFLAGGAIVLAASRVQMNLARNHRHLVEMLDQLPCAVVVSDEAGSMLYSNKRAIDLLNKQADEVIGNSFFTFFSYAEERGTDIQSYIRVTDAKSSRETVLRINTEPNNQRTMLATQIPIKLLNKDCLVTAIDRESDAAAPADWLHHVPA